MSVGDRRLSCSAAVRRSLSCWLVRNGRGGLSEAVFVISRKRLVESPPTTLADWRDSLPLGRGAILAATEWFVSAAASLGLFVGVTVFLSWEVLHDAGTRRPTLRRGSKGGISAMRILGPTSPHLFRSVYQAPEYPLLTCNATQGVGSGRCFGYL